MGRIFGVVAEFNPFHNGHKALLDEARRAGHSHCVAVMSGNYVQRGEPAVAEKRLRARMALECGVDLVVDLPTPYATATAGRFALGAVSLLRAAGCVETLCFGSESGDLSLLWELAEAVDDPALDPSPYLDRGMTYAKARSLAVADQLGEEQASLLSAPNNLLAVEYLRSARQLGWSPGFFTIERAGTAHDAELPSRQFASASFLRRQMGDLSHIRGYLPREGWRVLRKGAEEGLVPFDYAAFYSMAFAHLRRLSREDLARLPDLSEGLEGRLYAAIRGAESMEEMLWRAKTKRYPLSRIRRLLLSAYLSIAAEDAAAPPPYLRILGFNARGREILAEMKRGATLPVSPSLARLRETGEAAARLAALDERATDLYTAALPGPRPCGYEHTASGVFLEKGRG